MTLLEILGWSGTLTYLVNHTYLSLFSKWKKHIYYSGNLVAALALMISSAAITSWQAVFINGFWALVSLLLLIGLDLKKSPINPAFFYLSLAALLIWLLIRSIHEGEINVFILGWTSTLSFCAGYLLFSAGRMSVEAYLFWNTYAALMLLPQLWLDQNWPNFYLEVVWSVISAYGFIRRQQEPHIID